MQKDAESQGRDAPQEREEMNKIKNLRLEAKLSLNQFSRLADMDRATVSKAEKGGAV